jgi:selenium metabolism protein YedF
MGMKEIDARGLACPAPVMRTRDAVEKDGATEVLVIVDNAPAQQNVQRFLESRGFSVSLGGAADALRVTGRAPAGGAAAKAESAPAPVPRGSGSGTPKIMVLAATDRMGVGDDELGRKLMISFIKTLKEMGGELWRLVFVNNGVKLCIDGSPVLEDLRQYETDGRTILVCGTCLDHFKLLERKQVGQTTNMLDIVTAMQLADKVITL